MRKKWQLFFVLQIICASWGFSQGASVDKNRVLDFFQNQQYEEVIDYLSPALATDSSNIQSLAWMGYAQYMNENQGRASQCFLRILTLDPNNISALQYLSTIYRQFNPDFGQQYVQRLIALQPAKAAHWRAMGEIYRKMHEPDSALTFFDKAHGLAPTDLRNAASLAELLLEKKSYTRADSIIREGLGQDSSHIMLLRLAVRQAYETKDFNRAVVLGERLLALNDIWLSTQSQVILAYYNLKKYADCVRVCEFLRSNDLDVESIAYYEAKALAKQNEFAQSNELLQLCLTKAISKTAEMYYYNLGDNFEAMKQYKNAVAAYDTAWYLFRSPVMSYNNGRIMETKLKNPTLAKTYYRRYLQTARPETPEEKKAYQYVKSIWGKPTRK